MHTVRRKSLRVAPWLALVSLFVLGAATPAVQPGSVEELARATEWVEANHDRLPANLEALSAIPKVYRKAVFTALNVEQRILVQREHLESFTLPEASLSPVQRRTLASLGNTRLSAYQKSVVQAAMDSLAILFGPSLSQVDKEAMANRLCAWKKSVFSPAIASVIFLNLGPLPDKATRAYGSNDATRPSRQTSVLAASAFGGMEAMLARAISRLVSGDSPTRFYACNCNPCSLCDCSHGTWCPSAGGGCLPAGNNCGCFNAFPCVGWCPVS